MTPAVRDFIASFVSAIEAHVDQRVKARLQGAARVVVHPSQLFARYKWKPRAKRVSRG